MRRLLVTAVLAVALATCGSNGDPVTADGTSTTAGRGPTGAGAPVPGGGLTVEEAIESDAEGPLMVAGYLFVEGGGAHLCDKLLGSYPPECGTPWLVVEGLDLDEVDGLRREGGVAWTDDRVSLLGDVADGTITVTDTSI